MKPEITHEGKYGKGRFVVTGENEARIFFYQSELRPCVINGVAYNGVIDVKQNQDGQWTWQCNVMSRAESLGNYNRDQMSYKNREKLGAYYIEVAKELFQDNPEWSIEAQLDTIDYKRAGIKRELRELRTQIQQKELEDTRLLDQTLALMRSQQKICSSTN